MEDVPEAEVQALTGQPRVSALVVVKESSATHTRTHTQQQLRGVLRLSRPALGAWAYLT